MGEDAIFFETPAELRAWLEEHHATASELWVGYYKKGSGRRSLTWSQVVDEALCFGWIDGKAQRIDEHRYRQRLSPRRPNSNWSAINVAKVAELRAQGRMTPAGEGRLPRGAGTGRPSIRTSGATRRSSTTSRKRRSARTRLRGSGSRHSRLRIARWRRSGWSAPSVPRRARGDSPRGSNAPRIGGASRRLRARNEEPGTPWIASIPQPSAPP